MRQRLARRMVVLASLLASLGCWPSFAAEQAQFTYRAPQAGERFEREVGFRLELQTTSTIGEQVLDSNQLAFDRQERLHLRLLETGADRAKASVEFKALGESVSHNGKRVGRPGKSVVGKTYLVTRSGKDVTITDAAGRTPPDDELKIVKASMAAFGKPSPLSTYFNGKTIAVGQVVRLPNDLAKELFNPGEGQGVTDVSRFDMKLMELKRDGAKRCAVFETTIEAKSNEAGGMTLLVRGQTQIETHTCRMLAGSLEGPVAQYHSENVDGKPLTQKGSGKLSVTLSTKRVAANP